MNVEYPVISFRPYIYIETICNISAPLSSCPFRIRSLDRCSWLNEPVKCMRPSPFVGWNEIRREACAEASTFRDLPAWMTWETSRFGALPLDCVVSVRRRTVCYYYYYYGNRYGFAGLGSAATSGPYRMKGAGGRDEIEGQAAPCTHPGSPLTCPRTHLVMTCPYPVIYIV
jgi:hypothetical protein